MNLSIETSGTTSLIGEDVSREYLQRVANTFLRIDHIMTTITDINQLLKLIMIEAENLVDAETSGLLLYDETTQELFFELARGPKGSRLKAIRLSLDEGIAGYSARNRISLNIVDAQNDSRFFKKADETSKFVTRNMIAVPMLHKEKLIGILEVVNKKGADHFSDEDMMIMQVLGGQAAIAIENARLYEANLSAERLAAIGQAIAGLSHYVKNIVTGMQGSASLMEIAFKDKHYDILPRAWDIMKRSNEKVSKLVQDMLTFSKDRQPELEEVRLDEMVQDVIIMNEDRGKNIGVEIIFEPDSRISTVLVDRTGIERCILNFVNNALDALETAKLDGNDSTHIIIKSALTDGGTHWQLLFIDNGCGIPEDKIDKVLDAFYSSKGSRGTGLGLAVTNKIICEHGGRIDIDSEVGQGTTFTVTVPLEPPVGQSQ